MHHSDEVSRNILQQVFNCCEREEEDGTHLLKASTLRAHKGNAVAIVDVRDDRGHAVTGLGVESVSGHQLRAAERLVYVQTAERVVDGHRLQSEKKNKIKEQTMNQRKRRGV